MEGTHGGSGGTTLQALSGVPSITRIAPVGIRFPARRTGTETFYQKCRDFDKAIFATKFQFHCCSLLGWVNEMDKSDNSSMQPAAGARKRREIREGKPVREWTAAERREVFLEARRIERERAEAGISEEWELCEDCHESKCERGFNCCKKCIDEIRQYEVCGVKVEA